MMAANDRVEPTFGGEYALLAVGGAIVGVGVVTWLGAKLAALFSGGTVGGGHGGVARRRDAIGPRTVARRLVGRQRSPAARCRRLLALHADRPRACRRCCCRRSSLRGVGPCRAERLACGSDKRPTRARRDHEMLRHSS